MNDMNRILHRGSTFGIVVGLTVQLGSVQPATAQNADWVVGMTYTNFPDGSCRDKPNAKCVSHEEYKRICANSTGVTNGAIKSASVMKDARTQTVAESGTLTKVLVVWVPNLNGCGALLDFSGIYNGSSAKITLSGRAASFVFTSNGNFLVSYFDSI